MAVDVAVLLDQLAAAQGFDEQDRLALQATTESNAFKRAMGKVLDEIRLTRLAISRMDLTTDEGVRMAVMAQGRAVGMERSIVALYALAEKPEE